MKRTFFNITLASVITMVAYVFLYFIWGALLSGIENKTLHLFLISSMTTLAFGFFLLYITKIKKSVGEDEVILDYKDREYVSFFDDFKLVIKRESKMLICIVVIVFICFMLNSFDTLVFGKKTISFPTFFFLPMYIFGTLISFVGELLSAILDCAVYIIFLLIHRKKKYDYWTKNKI